MAFGQRVEPNEPSSLLETPLHFFKVVLPSTLKDKKLRIPQKFVRKFGHDLSDAATLLVPNGSCWRVGLKKDGRNIWFCDGWHKFVESHSITSGYFLFFKYEKNSSFHVVICDFTACEINYPCKYEESENVKHNSEFQNDMEKEDSDQIIGAATPNQSLRSLKSKHFAKRPTKGAFSKKNSSKAHQNRAKHGFGSAQRFRRNCPSAASPKNSKVKHKCKTQRKKYKMEEFVEIKESADDNEYDLSALLGEMGICITRRHGRLSAEESETIVSIAKSLKLKNPSFMLMLLSNEICRGHVYVPAKFAKKFFSRNARYIKLQASNGRELSIQICWRPKGGLFLTRGWAEFSNAKNLKEGDICIFELIRRKDVLLKFSVFQDPQNQANDTFGSAQQNNRKRQSAVSPGISNIKHKHKHEPLSKKCKIEEPVEIYESDGDKEYDLFALLGEKGIYIKKRCNLLSTEESKRAINVARSLKPKHPSFMVILRSSSIDDCLVYVPLTFANKFLGRDAKSIKVQASNETESWCIQISWRPYMGFLLTKGWAEFSKDKNLKEGDICIFELISQEDVLLKLSVFRG